MAIHEKPTDPLVSTGNKGNLQPRNTSYPWEEFQVRQVQSLPLLLREYESSGEHDELGERELLYYVPDHNLLFSTNPSVASQFGRQVLNIKFPTWRHEPTVIATKLNGLEIGPDDAEVAIQAMEAPSSFRFATMEVKQANIACYKKPGSFRTYDFVWYSKFEVLINLDTMQQIGVTDETRVWAISAEHAAKKALAEFQGS